MSANNELCIDVNSWHYKYYCRIRSYYGCDTNPLVMTSLCPYVQTMIWGTILLVVSLPFVISGWLFLKTCRWSYKQLEVRGYNNLVDEIDKSPLGYSLRKSTLNLEKNPWTELIAWCIKLFLTVGFIGGIIIAIVSIIALSYMGISSLPSILYCALIHVGWAIVQCGWLLVSGVILVFNFMYYILSVSCNWIVATLTSYAFWRLTGYFLASVVVALTTVFAIGWLLMQLATSKLFDKFMTWVSLRFNGYTDALEKAEVRRVVAKQAVAQKKLPIKTKSTRVALLVSNMVESISDFFHSTYVVVGNRKQQILSPFAIIWKYMWSAKKAACPLVKFVDTKKN